MFANQNVGLSTSTQSAKGPTPKIPAMPNSPDDALTGEPVAKSSPSPTRLTKLYETEEFRLAWKNSVRYQIARHLSHLRRFRKYSQAKVAGRMNSSQSAVARIETGEENTTEDTIERMVTALDGCFLVSIAPKELHFPWVPHPWWELLGGGIAAGTPLTYNGTVAADDGRGTLRVIAGWTGKTSSASIAISSTKATLIGGDQLNG